MSDTPCLCPEEFFRIIVKCDNLKESLASYVGILGFEIVYQRSEEHFAYLRRKSAELMLEQIGAERDWITAPLEHPYGRGVNFQIEVDDVHAFYATIEQKRVPIFAPLEEKWYRKGSARVGQIQFLVQDLAGNVSSHQVK